MKQNYDFTKYDGETMYGRVRCYSMKRGYGFITTEVGTDIYLSSYDLQGNMKRKINIGTTLRFIPIVRNGRYVASNVEIIDNSVAAENVYLPNGEQIPVKIIEKITFSTGANTLKIKGVSEVASQEHGLNPDDFDATCIQVKGGTEYFVFSKACPLNAENKAEDAKKYYAKLCDRFFRL